MAKTKLMKEALKIASKNSKLIVKEMGKHEVGFFIGDNTNPEFTIWNLKGCTNWIYSGSGYLTRDEVWEIYGVNYCYEIKRETMLINSKKDIITMLDLLYDNNFKFKKYRSWDIVSVVDKQTNAIVLNVWFCYHTTLITKFERFNFREKNYEKITTFKQMIDYVWGDTNEIK